MPASQFDSPATLEADGTVRVGGDVEASFATLSDVEFRFLLVQGEVVVQGSGRGSNDRWAGTTDPGQAALQAGSVLAIGLAVVARQTPQPGYQTFSWSEQIDLVAAS